MRVKYLIAALCVGFSGLFLTANASFSTELVAQARVDSVKSGVVRRSNNRSDITFSLSNGVPFRVFTLAQPNRLIIDFQDIDWRTVERQKFLENKIITDLRFGVFQPGWSRIVMDLETPFEIESAGVKTLDDGALLTISLIKVSQNEFDLASGTVDDGRWTRQKQEAPKQSKSDRITVAIDPGHGGVDPGAVREGVMEKDLVLDFSLELASMISASGIYDVFLTRDADQFVSLGDRVRLAREAGADIFLSIHVNTVTFGDASGASVNTLSERASDVASAKLAELENRADTSSGLETGIEEDEVVRALVDLARTDTNARSKIAAETILENLKQSVGILRGKPHRHAGFRVLKAYDIPSVLIELGFMSNARDRRNIQTEEWRREAALAILSAIDDWVVKDAARSALVFK